MSTAISVRLPKALADHLDTAVLEPGHPVADFPHGRQVMADKQDGLLATPEIVDPVEALGKALTGVTRLVVVEKNATGQLQMLCARHGSGAAGNQHHLAIAWGTFAIAMMLAIGEGLRLTLPKLSLTLVIIY
jgi:hypothetical protein